MNILDQPTRRLLVECAFVAVNHSLFDDAEILLEALPLLTDNATALTSSQALILFGLGRANEALSCLADRDDEEGQLLRSVIASTLPPAGVAAQQMK